MPLVKVLRDTVHPDHGAIAAGTVVDVSLPYMREYELFGIAERVEDDPSWPRPLKPFEKPPPWWNPRSWWR